MRIHPQTSLAAPIPAASVVWGFLLGIKNPHRGLAVGIRFDPADVGKNLVENITSLDFSGQFPTGPMWISVSHNADYETHDGYWSFADRYNQREYPNYQLNDYEYCYADSKESILDTRPQRIHARFSETHFYHPLSFYASFL